MVPLILFLIGIQIPHAVLSLQFFEPTCNSSSMKAAAEASLDQLNAHRSEGYILKLQRIFDIQHIPVGGLNIRFYLALDVLETQCHVLSRKPWKECEKRDLSQTVYGQCKVIAEFSRNLLAWQLLRYECILHPVPHSEIQLICPDCPAPGNPSDAIFQETAAETLAKFNTENTDNNYFAILNVTKASSQWVIGPANFVEYTIQETSCPKNPPVSDVTKCPFLPVETAERGLCKGSVVNSQIENKKFVTVKCSLFPHPPPVTGEQTPQSISEPQEPQDTHTSPDSTETSPKRKEIVGQVIYHDPESKHAGPEVQEPNPTSSPTLASPEEKTNSQLAKPAKLDILPFPKGFSQIPSCPGEILIEVHGVQLPSYPQAETS